MLSLMGPDDLKVYLEGNMLLGKDWSRGLLTNTHTYERPLELWKYFHKDTDGVPGTNFTNAPAAPLDPGIYDTSLRNKKQVPDNLPFTVTHHSILVERRSSRDETIADDVTLVDAGNTINNLFMLEARVWYELYLTEDKVPADEGMITEFPPGFGPEGDFTLQNTAIIRTGMNNMSVVRPLPRPVYMAKDNIVRSILRPVHGLLALVITGGSTVGAVGLRNTIYWFKQ